MSLTLGYLLATVAAQAGSAYFNCKRGSKQAKELARKQQEYEKRIMQKGIANAQREFAELCALQRELEHQIQLDRAQMIRENHNASLFLDAYRDSLEKWPLFVPPFIIKNEMLPLLDCVKQDEMQTIAVNCILTPSMDSSFNKKIFLQLEEKLAQFFSKYWATNTLKAIRFYQNAWRDNIWDVGTKMHDLKAHLNEVPTIVLSPIIEDNKLLFSFSWWGFSNNPDDEHIMEADNVYNPELSIEVTNNMTYNADIIETILNESTTKLAAFISFFADLYYWNYYHISPSLPTLLSNNSISLDQKSLLEHIKAYTQIASKFNAKKEPYLIEEHMSFISELGKVSEIKTKQSTISRYLQSLELCDSLPISLVQKIKFFAIVNNVLKEDFTIESLLNEKYEEIQIIEGISIDEKTIQSVFEELSVNAYEPVAALYINWSNNIIIGTFCDENGDISMFGDSNTSHFVVLMNDNATFTESSTFNIKESPINIIKLDGYKMNRNERKDSFRSKIGRRLIKVGERLASYDQNDSRNRTNASQSPWGNDGQEKQTVDEIQSITSYFVKGVDARIIPYSQQDTSMSLEPVLNWLDSLNDNEVSNNNQVYIVKSKHQASGKVIYCTFLAENDVFDLESSPKVCFVCDAEPYELKSLFNGKLVYVIPFE